MVVKAKPVEKLTMTAAATAVKEITLTFNKAVADTTVAKITVKKGNATPTQTAKWADDKKSVVLAMDSKLTKGTYDVTLSGLEKEDLTASVTVEDQKLTAFELLSTNLVADALPASFGTIKFKAVDQYGKEMKTDGVTITSSFGTVGKKNAAGTDVTAYSGIVKAEVNAVDIKLISALATIGAKGTITIVGKNGVNLTSEITLVAPAQAAKVECLGLYNTEKQKFMDMTAGDKISEYVIAMKFTDQYDTELTADEAIAADITNTISSGMTNVIFDAEGKETIDGKEVYVVKLKSNDVTGKAKAGDLQVTVVNSKYGLLGNLSLTVLSGTVIKSFSVSSDNEIYAGEEVELSYTAIDAEGNEVTKYDTLNKANLKVTCSDASYVKFKKQADGSAKLVAKFNEFNDGNSDKDYKDTKPTVAVFTLYDGETYTIISNSSFTVYEERVFWEVTGFDSTKVTATTKMTALEYKAEYLKVADQYGNTLSSSKIKDMINSAKNKISVEVEGNWSVKDENGSFVTALDSNDKFMVVPNVAAKAGDGKIKFTVANPDAADDGYKLTVSQVEAGKASNFAIEWKNGNTFCVSNADLVLGDDHFQVTGTVGGKKVIIPTENYQIVSGNKQGAVSPAAIENKGKDRITKTATLTVVVDDYEHNTNVITADYTYSNADSKLTKLATAGDGKLTATERGDNKISLDEIIASAFEMKDQYSQVMAASKSPSDLVASITAENGKGAIIYNNTHNAYVATDSDGNWPSAITVTLTCGDLTATRTITIE